MSVSIEDMHEWKRSLEGEIEDLDSKIRPLTESLFKKREELNTVERLIAIRDGSRRVESAAVTAVGGPSGNSLSDLSLVDAVCRVLGNSGKPLHYQELAHKLQASGYQIPGENPGANLIAHMVRDSRLVRCARGTYALREWAASPHSNLRVMSGRRRRRQH